MSGGLGYFGCEQEARIRLIVREEISARLHGPDHRAHFRQMLEDLGFPVVAGQRHGDADDAPEAAT